MYGPYCIYHFRTIVKHGPHRPLRNPLPISRILYRVQYKQMQNELSLNQRQMLHLAFEKGSARPDVIRSMSPKAVADAGKGIGILGYYLIPFIN